LYVCLTFTDCFFQILKSYILIFVLFFLYIIFLNLEKPGFTFCVSLPFTDFISLKKLHSIFSMFFFQKINSKNVAFIVNY